VDLKFSLINRLIGVLPSAVNFKSLFTLLFMALLTGCVHQRLDARYAGPKRPTGALKSSPSKIAYEEKEVEKAAAFSEKEIRFDAGDGRTQILTFFAVPATNPSPVIMISPAMGGSYWLEKRIARYFAGRGYPVVLVQRIKVKLDPNRTPDVLELDHSLEGRIREHQRALDWIATQPSLDPRKVGVIGISKGAIDTTLLLAHDTRVSAAVLLLAGGNLPYVIAYTREPHLQKQRRALLEKLKIDEVTLREKLEREMVWEPTKFADQIDARSVLMILGLCDTIVPFKCGLELRNALGKPETYIIPTGHISAYFLKGYIQKKTLEFFARKFAESKGAAQTAGTVPATVGATLADQESGSRSQESEGKSGSLSPDP
jgi:dienelactone hydrolase